MQEAWSASPTTGPTQTKSLKTTHSLQTTGSMACPPRPSQSSHVSLHIMLLTRSIRDSEYSIDFVQGWPGSRRERVNVHVCTHVSSEVQNEFSCKCCVAPSDVTVSWPARQVDVVFLSRDILNEFVHYDYIMIFSKMSNLFWRLVKINDQMWWIALWFIMEDVTKWLNKKTIHYWCIHVCVVWWCSDGSIHSQEYKSFDIPAITGMVKFKINPYTIKIIGAGMLWGNKSFFFFFFFFWGGAGIVCNQWLAPPPPPQALFAHECSGSTDQDIYDWISPLNKLSDSNLWFIF